MFHQGFSPVVTVESQAAGIKAIVSNKVTKEIDLGLGLIDFVGINNEDKYIC